MTYCDSCHWDITSHGHYRECVQPKREAEESARVAKLESDLSAALLQVDALKGILRRVEWANDGPMKSYCPLCDYEKGNGHDEGCDLGHALHGAFPPTTEKRFCEHTWMESAESGTVCQRCGVSYFVPRANEGCRCASNGAHATFCPKASQ